MRNTTIILILITSFILGGCSTGSINRERLNLAGEWQFKIDETGDILNKNLTNTVFSESIILPGTTDTNNKGRLNDSQDETTFLSRKYKYVGKAWYKKEVIIPENWKGKNISLTLERTKPTRIWINGKDAGSNDDISTPQVYNLTKFLTPGKHDILIMVDNGESVPRQLISSSHAYTESTQTNWNGIIGEIYLEAKNEIYLNNCQVYPNQAKNEVVVKFDIQNIKDIDPETNIEISAKSWNSNKKHRVNVKKYSVERNEDEYRLVYPLGSDALHWSEFDPALYELTINLNGYDKQVINFGLRNFSSTGTQFTINGDKTFLRGKHDACVFPLTAHTAMDLDSWRRYFRICKEYGINHCRFHSWCPPKACFEAADIEGIYLQAELPFWGGLRRKEEYLISFLEKEGINIQNYYGNHASFVMFALGNELSGDLDVMEEFINKFRQIDNRHIYAYGANNFLGTKGYLEGEDFLVTCRIGYADDYSTHTRGSFAFADAEEGGILNNTYPNSKIDFSKAITRSKVPVISHETGQFQVYPNYNEIDKYTGVLKPSNIEIFRNRLNKSGMLSQADDFFKASGRWSALLYKADIEMDLRTKDFGGFQLLDLQDYPGQGSAFVGILDAFMDSKGHISSEEWREFCNDIVPLFVTDKFCYYNNEKIEGEIKIANYSNKNIKNKNLLWNLKSKTGELLDNGSIVINSDKRGLLEIGQIMSDISKVNSPTEFQLVVEIEGTEYRNRYPLWVYPKQTSSKNEDIHISNNLNENTINILKEGGNVLFIPKREYCENQTVKGLFQTDYWNYRMFKSICDRIGKPSSPGTLGILTNPEHPIFNSFPTDYHTNWQWYSIVKQSYPMILDNIDTTYKPIVQVIDNVERNHKLGLVFEFSVEKGKLLICMSDIDSVIDKPEVESFKNSLINYIKSDSFNPETNISLDNLKKLFNDNSNSSNIKLLENISYN